jgi:hypothetical protein
MLCKRGGPRLLFLTANEYANTPVLPIVAALLQRLARLDVFLDIHDRLNEVVVSGERQIQLRDSSGTNIVLIPIREYERYWRKSEKEIEDLHEQRREVRSWLPSYPYAYSLQVILSSLATQSGMSEPHRTQARTIIEHFFEKYHSDTLPNSSDGIKGKLIVDWKPHNPQQALDYVRDLGEVIELLNGGLSRFLSYLHRLDFTRRKGAPKKVATEALLIYDLRSQKKTWGQVTRRCQCGHSVHTSCKKRLQEQQSRLCEMLSKYQIKPSVNI